MRNADIGIDDWQISLCRGDGYEIFACALYANCVISKKVKTQPSLQNENMRNADWNWWFVNISLQRWRFWSICMSHIIKLHMAFCTRLHILPDLINQPSRIEFIVFISVADRLPPAPDQPCPLWALALSLRDTRWRNCIRKVRNSTKKLSIIYICLHLFLPVDAIAYARWGIIKRNYLLFTCLHLCLPVDAIASARWG